MKTAILLMFLAVATVSGDDAVALSRSGGFINGRAWRAWAGTHRLGYVVGFGDGIRAALISKAVCPDDAECSKNYFGRSTYGEIENALDDFYRDPANVQIPVETAMIYFQSKVTGTSEEDLARNLAFLRKAAAAMQ